MYILNRYYSTPMHPPSNALIFATSYMKSADDWSLRYEPWFNFYSQSSMGHLPLLLIDDGSPYLPKISSINIVSRIEDIDFQNYSLNIFRFPNNLGRSSLVAYPGWWRSFIFSSKIAKSKGFHKIIHLESDAYILSSKFFDQINQLDQGWHVPWLAKYKMPETAIQIICRDQIDGLDEFACNSDMNIKMAEEILPFTSIRKDWVGDRYSEFKKNRWIFRSRKFDRFKIFQKNFFFEPIPSNADFATQVVPRQLSDPRFQKCFSSAL